MQDWHSPPLNMFMVPSLTKGLSFEIPKMPIPRNKINVMLSTIFIGCIG